MTSRLPRPTLALIVVATISLLLVGSTRLGGSPSVLAAPGTQRVTLPVDPTDVIAVVAATDLRSSPEPRLLHGFAWLLSGSVALVGLLLGWFMVADADSARRRGRLRIRPPGRAPPVAAFAPLG